MKQLMDSWTQEVTPLKSQEIHMGLKVQLKKEIQ